MIHHFPPQTLDSIDKWRTDYIVRRGDDGILGGWDPKVLGVR